MGKKGLQESWKDIEGVPHYQGIFFVLEIIRTELISQHNDNLPANYFEIEKTWELIAR